MIDIVATQELPTGMLRFVEHVQPKDMSTGEPARALRILQQEWRVTEYTADGTVVHKQWMEWRDVPLAEEDQ